MFFLPSQEYKQLFVWNFSPNTLPLNIKAAIFDFYSSRKLGKVLMTLAWWHCPTPSPLLPFGWLIPLVQRDEPAKRKERGGGKAMSSCHSPSPSPTIHSYLIPNTASQRNNCALIRQQHYRLKSHQPFNFHEWPRHSFSLQHLYKVKQKSDENNQKYQLGDH